jgi:hypothetical protein
MRGGLTGSITSLPKRIGNGHYPRDLLDTYTEPKLNIKKSMFFLNFSLGLAYYTRLAYT